MDRLPWKTILATYPNEYVALIDSEETPTQILSGILVAHDTDKKKFDKKMKQLGSRYPELSISYTGKLVEDTFRILRSLATISA